VGRIKDQKAREIIPPQVSSSGGQARKNSKGARRQWRVEDSQSPINEARQVPYQNPVSKKLSDVNFSSKYPRGSLSKLKNRHNQSVKSGVGAEFNRATHSPLRKRKCFSLMTTQVPVLTLPPATKLRQCKRKTKTTATTSLKR
jgi:hypothetical protein